MIRVGSSGIAVHHLCEISRRERRTRNRRGQRVDKSTACKTKRRGSPSDWVQHWLQHWLRRHMALGICCIRGIRHRLLCSTHTRCHTPHTPNWRATSRAGFLQPETPGSPNPKPQAPSPKPETRNPKAYKPIGARQVARAPLVVDIVHRVRRPATAESNAHETRSAREACKHSARVSPMPHSTRAPHSLHTTTCLHRAWRVCTSIPWHALPTCCI